MKTVLVLLASLAIIGSLVCLRTKSESDGEFVQFVQKYRKSYFSAQEYAFRKTVFEQNLEEIALLNANPLESASFGVNHFGDWTQEEKASLLTLPKKTHSFEKLEFVGEEPLAEKDWRETKDIFNEVKDSKACGSCWAFTANEILEAAWSIKYKKLYDLSEQELVDCT